MRRFRGFLPPTKNPSRVCVCGDLTGLPVGGWAAVSVDPAAFEAPPPGALRRVAPGTFTSHLLLLQ